ncbi:MAG: polysaccharide deacetylase family protein [Defluviitaleaceae bacterium]|nr:polysaccharide deacetylase family protein [Defluviitaleaceae bacterium]
MDKNKRKAIFTGILGIAVVATILIAMNASRENPPQFVIGEPIPIPILMFHRVMEDEIIDPYMDVTADQLHSFLTAMTNAGFNAVSFTDLENFVIGEQELPQNPFVITFDDGYLCNYTLAFPILQELGLPATINIIGSRRGAYTYAGQPSTPHFTWEQAETMVSSGLITIGNHTYDMHGAPGITEGRLGATQLPNETDTEFAAAFAADMQTFNQYYFNLFMETPRIFAYPFGWSNPTTEQALRQSGYSTTLLTGEAVSTIRRLEPFTLHNLYRINVNGNYTPEDLIWLIQTQSRQALENILN